MNYIPAECSARSLGPANQLVNLLIQTLLTSYCSISETNMWPKNCLEAGTDKANFDYIIVGAGTAGCVVAGRLTENPNTRVLLLEAGGDPPIESEIPNLFGTLLRTKYTWDYTAYSKNACGASGNQCYWPVGKVLGGTSSINHMLFIRGNKYDFNHWASLGNKNWDYKNVLKYMRLWEDNEDWKIANYANGRYHGRTGPNKITTLPEYPYAKFFMDAARELGYPEVCDINADKTVGFFDGQGFVYQGLRQSAAKAYLVPAKNRSNLCVITQAQAYKILFDENKKAIGVQYNYNGTQNYTAYARKEVVVSAGTVGSPQLLLLSGIGPKSQLNQFNISTINDLKVGENLQDHPMAILFFQISRKAPSMTEPLDELQEFLIHRTGPLTSNQAIQLSALINTINNTQYSDPDIQFLNLISPQNSPIAVGYLTQMGYSPTIIQQLQTINEKYQVAGVPVILQHPKSVGYVKLNSSSYLDFPVINANFYDHPDDISTTMRGIKKRISFLKTKAFKKYSVKLIKLKIPGCDNLEYKSNEYWKCYIKYSSLSTFHTMGTCKMGPKSDPGAVVDDELRVYGVKGLRVADTSIMPAMVVGNLHAEALMIGEKAADMIKKAAN